MSVAPPSPDEPRSGRARRRAAAAKAARRPGRRFWIALGAVALLGTGTLTYIATRPAPGPIAVDPSLPPIKVEGYVLGNATAPVEVIEFADFECPTCAYFSEMVEPEIRSKLIMTGLVRFRFIDFPLPQHKNTWDASMAAACAHDQGKFWPMHDLIFSTQDDWATAVTKRPRKVLRAHAKSLALDLDVYDTCMDTEVHRRKIDAHLAEALRRKANSTPAFLIDGRLYPGAMGVAAMSAAVNAVVAKRAAAGDSSARAASGATPDPASASPAAPPAWKRAAMPTDGPKPSIMMGPPRGAGQARVSVPAPAPGTVDPRVVPMMPRTP